MVSRSEYLVSQKGFHLKNYAFEYLPQERNKYHMFVKYDFQVTDTPTTLFIKVDTPGDKCLLKYMRIKIINKND